MIQLRIIRYQELCSAKLHFAARADLQNRPTDKRSMNGHHHQNKKAERFESSVDAVDGVA